MTDRELLVEARAKLHEEAFDLFEQGRDEEAFFCMLRSAELGDVLSQYYVGCCYEQGRGVERDWARAAAFYERVSACREAVVSESPLSPQCEAEFALSQLYERGLLADETGEMATAWLTLAMMDGYHEQS